MVDPVLAELDPPKGTGRKRIDPRAALDGIIFRMRSGCQRNQLPQQFPDDSSVHRTFQRWRSLGVFAQLWRDLEEGCDDLGGVDWEWQAGRSDPRATLAAAAALGAGADLGVAEQ